MQEGVHGCCDVLPRYRALAGKKGMVECQRLGAGDMYIMVAVSPQRGFSLSIFCNYIVAVLRRLEFAAVDFVVAHAYATAYDAQAAKTAGWTAARAEQTKQTRFRKDVPYHAAFWFVPARRW